jgi:predicted nucleotidyltransferase
VKWDLDTELLEKLNPLEFAFAATHMSMIAFERETTEALKRLRTFAGALKERGATSLYLFGSTARNQASSKSDLDLFLDYDPRSKFNAFDLVAAKRLLQEGMGVDVDLTTRSGLPPLIRKKIEAEATRVF